MNNNSKSEHADPMQELGSIIEQSNRNFSVEFISENREGQWIHEHLRQLEQDFYKARQPYIDMLVWIESIKPPSPIIISKEQWESLSRRNDLLNHPNNP